MRFILLFILLFSLNTFLQAQNYSIKASVQVWVDDSQMPDRLILRWLPDPDATNYYVYRKTKTATTWGNIIGNLPKDSLRFVDSNVEVGKAYEYRVSKVSTVQNGFGYIYAGVEVPPIEWRGSILLVVDSAVNRNLKMEIDRWKSDLTNEAWNVITFVPSVRNTVVDIRTRISDIKKLNPDLKTVFLLGHIKVPYSGNIAPDSHVPDHVGAWAADTYYADLDGMWTDFSVDNNGANRAENKNIPGDGKFDQFNIPSDADVEVGRVDFFNMPALVKSETELYRQYLNKNHAWRNGMIQAERRGIVLDNFNFAGEAFGQNGIRNFSVLFGPSNVEYGNYRDSLRKKSYLCSYGSGAGSYTSAAGISTTANMATDSLQTVFTFLFGSYFGDWDSPNNFLRAALASGTVLTNAWAGRPHWAIHHMAKGDHIGYSTRLSMNNTTSLYNSGFSPRSVHMALMGDPSLTMYPFSGVSSLRLTEIGADIELKWSPSAQATHGYYIYRRVVGNTIFDVIARNVTDTVYRDKCMIPGLMYEYMIRAVKLESNASGSFYNLSIGIRDTISKMNNPLPQAQFTYTNDFEFFHFKSESKNVRDVRWIIGKDTFYTSEINVELDCRKNPQQICLIAAGDCEEDMLCRSIGFDCSIPQISKFKVDSIKCYGEKGGIEIEDVLGADPFTFNWKNGQTSNKLSNVGAGIYDVTITSAKGTKRIYSYEIIQPDSISLNYTIKPADPGKQNGGITNLTIKGGTPPYQYMFSGGNKLDSVAAGSYTLRITDANGCQKTQTINVPINTATKDIVKNNSLNLYPSPASDYIHIDIAQSAKIKSILLIDAQAKVIRHLPVTSGRISISELAPGWYSLHCITKSGIEYYPFEKL
jgi:hypothetical protein